MLLKNKIKVLKATAYVIHVCLERFISLFNFEHCTRQWMLFIGRDILMNAVDTRLYPGGTIQIIQLHLMGTAKSISTR